MVAALRSMQPAERNKRLELFYSRVESELEVQFQSAFNKISDFGKGRGWDNNDKFKERKGKAK